jgi:RND superfamily putative drug exporter
MTGSLMLPIKAVVMNLLPLSAAFGVLMLIFQDGRFQDQSRTAKPAANDSSAPWLACRRGR